MAEGNGAAAMGGPMTWAKMVTTMGVPAVIALGFSYWVTQEVNAAQRRIADQATKIVQMQMEVNAKLQQVLDFQQRGGDELLFYSYQNCVILARVAKVDSETYCLKRPAR